MIISEPLWTGKNRYGSVVLLIAYRPEEREYPLTFLKERDSGLYDLYNTGLKGQYYGSASTRDRHDRDIIGLPKDLSTYLKGATSAMAVNADMEARKNAIMECNKLVLILALDKNTEQSKGAQKCVDRLTALLDGKKAPKIPKPKKAKKAAIISPKKVKK